jgi:DNA end-binding protein Ku
MKAIWSGTIGFGLVNIPVKLFAATQSSELELDMLDKKDHANIKYLKVNENTGKEVEWNDIVKGYKYNDEYVVLDDSDFEEANAKKTKTIEIENFVKIEEVDAIYYENSYYVAPDASGSKAYYLLQQALLKTGKAGIASFVMRSKEKLALLRATEKIILLHRLHFYEEIRNIKDLNLTEKVTFKGKEIEMAISLINQVSDKFDITAYKNTYSEELMKIIEQKAKGIKKPKAKMKVIHSKSTDLMSQLKASLDLKLGKHKAKAS